MRDISIEELLQKESGVIIDVRSPSEFELDSIPGAYNVPLFSDEERARVGTTYKQQGQEAAQWLGMQIVAPKMEQLMKQIRTKAEETGQPPTIFCWRGGMRSKAMATFATFSGIPVQRLIGGYRSYRKLVVRTLETFEITVPVILLHGMTGVGKTEILHRMEAKGMPVIDLERMAGHRGSVFGHLGGLKPANQKMFEARLFDRLRNLSGARYYVMEAESKRIGNAVMPPFLLDAKQKAVHIYLTAPMEVRVQRVYDEYVAPYQETSSFQAKVAEAFKNISRKIPTEQSHLAAEAIDQKDYRQVIRLLMLYYYDPRYQNKLGEYQGQFHEVDAADITVAEKQITTLIKEVTFLK